MHSVPTNLSPLFKDARRLIHYPRTKGLEKGGEGFVLSTGNFISQFIPNLILRHNSTKGGTSGHLCDLTHEAVGNQRRNHRLTDVIFNLKLNRTKGGTTGPVMSSLT